MPYQVNQAGLVGDGDEERTGMSSLSKVAAKVVTSRNRKSLERAITSSLDIGKHPRLVFASFKLDATGVKLDDTPLFLHWLNYVERYRRNHIDFSDFGMLQFLRKSNSDETLVELFQSIRQVPEMKKIADTLQRNLYWYSENGYKIMESVWLKSRVSPEEVFNIFLLRSESLERSSTFSDWLRYMKLFRKEYGADSFSDLHLIDLLSKANYRVEAQLGIFMQKLKGNPEFETLAESVQKTLFHKWIHNKHDINPKTFGDLLVNPGGEWKSLLMLPKTDARFKTLEGYTLQYAVELRGKSVKENVKKLFDGDNPEAALALAMNS
ncbi:Secreted RxLR effector peptide protein [Phytophthora palmivora]|uniref:Secreted RxLR effector peptide protein n=1 Tax=Phytophthora palmivora TaxID=4796 RepID=A0A2P4Y8K8_9STRA|nr:Secreted RxLR effector peptide protein [Phytophthora palmivora]